MNLYDGKQRMMKPDGSYEDFEAKDYLDYISELVVDWSFVKFPYNKKWGEFSMDSCQSTT